VTYNNKQNGLSDESYYEIQEMDRVHDLFIVICCAIFVILSIGLQL